MAFAKSRLPIERVSLHRTERVASALGRVAHLLARQVAREVIASELGVEQDEEAGDRNPAVNDSSRG